MKKLILVPVLAFGFVFGAVAQEEASAVNEDTAVVASASQDFVEVAVKDLPQEIKDAVAKDHAGHTISKAYTTSDVTTFKLKLVDKAGKIVTVYSDAKGNWIKKDKKDKEGE